MAFQKRFLTYSEAALLLGGPDALREAVLFHELAAYADLPIVVSNPTADIPHVPVTHALLSRNAARICAAQGTVHAPFMHIGRANTTEWSLEASVAGEGPLDADIVDGVKHRGAGEGFLLDRGEGETFVFTDLCFLSTDIARLVEPARTELPETLEARERASVYRVIGALAAIAKLPTERYKAAAMVQAKLKQGGVSLGESTIAKYLTAAEDQLMGDSSSWPPSQ